jgi:succinoglycan biosynthesis protein ExoM
MKVLISAITHSRPQGLETLLNSLQSLSIPEKISAEICIVDNDCTGNNDPVVASFKNHPIKIHFLKEPQKGIVFARNAAVDFFLKSDFDALAFIDDDEWTNDTFWLFNLLNVMEKTDADIVTSDVLTVPENEKISWTTYAMGRSKNLPDMQWTSKFYTGNVLIKRHVLETIQPAFDEHFALTGSSDFHFSLKCKYAGFKCIYTNKAPVSEIFPESRATFKWFFLRGYRNGSGAARAEVFEAKNKKKVTFKLLMMVVVRSGRGLLTVLRGLLSWNKGLLALGIMRIASGIGTVAGMFNITYEEYRTIHGK